MGYGKILDWIACRFAHPIESTAGRRLSKRRLVSRARSATAGAHLARAKPKAVTTYKRADASERPAASSLRCTTKRRRDIPGMVGHFSEDCAQRLASLGLGRRRLALKTRRKQRRRDRLQALGTLGSFTHRRRSATILSFRSSTTEASTAQAIVAATLADWRVRVSTILTFAPQTRHEHGAAPYLSRAGNART